VKISHFLSMAIHPRTASAVMASSQKERDHDKRTNILREELFNL